MKWGNWNQSCQSNTRKRHSSILWDIPFGVSWEKSCAEQITPEKTGIDGPNRTTWCENKGTSMWGHVDVDDASCNPRWGVWEDHKCVGKERKYASILWDIKGNWEQACKDFIGKHNVQGNVVRTNCPPPGSNQWGEVFVSDTACVADATQDKSGIHWGDWATSCDKGKKKYSSRLWNVQGDWMKSCNEMITPEKSGINGTGRETKCVDLGASGIWGEIWVDDGNCRPILGTFKDDGCTKEGTHKWSSRLDRGGTDPRTECEALAKNHGIAGETVSTQCVENAGWWAEVFLVDSACDNSRLDTSVNKKGSIPPFDIMTTDVCFQGITGEFGEMHPEVMEPLTTDSVFTIECYNWISANEGQRTYLRAEGAEGLRTIDHVKVEKDELTTQYQFTFSKVDCQTDKYILFGNHVQLKSMSNGKYARCASGTCSLVETSGSCKNDAWETFSIESTTGKTGRVCYGDQVYIAQVVGDLACITPAGDAAVWAVKKGENKNSILRLMGKNGSLYVNPRKEMADYDVNVRCKKLCDNAPSDPACTLGACSPLNAFWKKNKAIIITVCVILLLLSLSSGFAYVKMQVTGSP